MEPVETKPKKSPRDRVILDQESMNIVETHLHCIRIQLGEMISISTKQIVNFLLQQRAEALSATEMSAIKTCFADKLKLLKSIVARANAAKREGREYSIEEEIKILETLSVSEIPRSKRGRKPKPAQGMHPDAHENSESPVEAAEALKLSSNEVVATQPPVRKKSKPTMNSTGEFELENL